MSEQQLTRICTVPNCGRPVHHRMDICVAHYKRKWRGNAIEGKPLRPANVSDMSPTELKAHFLSKTTTTIAGCWEWTGALMDNGFGQIYGIFALGKTNYLAHRFSWTIHNGEIGEGLFVCHRCDNPRCVNPDHLFLGTHRDNMDDMGRKGRHCKGENYKSAKLTDDIVRQLRQRHASGESVATLASELSVSRTIVSLAIHRKTWKHVV